MMTAPTPFSERFPLFRPLVWSAAIHLGVFLLFSAGAGRSLRLRPVGFLMNWSPVPAREVSLFLAPAERPSAVPAVGPGPAERTSIGREAVSLTAARLRDLRIPMERVGEVSASPIDIGKKSGPGLRFVGSGGESEASGPGLAGPVSGYLPGRPPLPDEFGQRPGPVPVPEWRNLSVPQDGAPPAKSLGLHGDEALMERGVLAAPVPRREKTGTPAVYRFRVTPDGRVAAIQPLSAGDSDWMVKTSEALLEWRFAPLPPWADREDVWGTVAFE